MFSLWAMIPFSLLFGMDGDCQSGWIKMSHDVDIIDKLMNKVWCRMNLLFFWEV
jgi:hypothetical protein